MYIVYDVCYNERLVAAENARSFVEFRTMLHCEVVNLCQNGHCGRRERR